jgi:hypothetical protein
MELCVLIDEALAFSPVEDTIRCLPRLRQGGMGWRESAVEKEVESE